MCTLQAYVIGAGGTIRKFSPAFGKLKSTEQQLEGGILPGPFTIENPC